MMKQLSGVVAAMTLAWLAPGQVEAQQRCRANVDCGPGWVCAATQCVQEDSVTVQAGAGAVGAQLSVTDQGGQQGDEQETPQPHPIEYVERPIWNPIGPLAGLLWAWLIHTFVSGFGMMEMEERGSPIAQDFFSMGLVPLAGPWIQLGITQDAGDDDDGWAPGLVISGLIQAGGLTLTILGSVLTEQVAASADLGNGVHLAVSPGIGSLSASLTF